MIVIRKVSVINDVPVILGRSYEGHTLVHQLRLVPDPYVKGKALTQQLYDYNINYTLVIYTI